jgi:DNA-binding CsgD family transcriptional regulator
MGAAGSDLMVLDESRHQISVGKSSQCDLVIDGDAAISRLHARFEVISGHWYIEDLGSRNGTQVNSERLFAPKVLHDGDDILMGVTRLRFRDLDSRQERDGTTQPVQPAPPLSPRERQVLIELCRPIMSGKAFRPPATAKDIADALYVGEPAVRQHLVNLYDKFGIYQEGTEPRRVRLANEAIQRGAVNPSDFKDPPQLT